MHSWLEIGYAEVEEELVPKACPVNYEPDVQLISPDIEFCSGSAIESEEEAETEPMESKIEKITLYIQMELCKTTLYEYLNSNIEYNYEERLKLAYQIVKALSVIHDEYGFIHRDVTPKNIFFAQHGKVKIGDFGLATTCKNFTCDLPSPLITPTEYIDEVKELNIGEYIEEDAKNNNTLLTNGIGTKEFTSPEQLSKSYYDQSTDIYSLGLVFLCLFCHTETQSERFTQLRNCRDGKLPVNLVDRYPQVASLIQAMISVVPSERPKAKEVLEHPLFEKFHWETEAKPCPVEDVFQNEAYKAMVMIGEKGKLREMYIRVVGGKLLGYKSLENKKARFSYPLSECSIEFTQVSAFLGSEEPIIGDMEVEIVGELTSTEESPIVSHDDILEIKHPQLETLYLMINAQQTRLIADYNG